MRDTESAPANTEVEFDYAAIRTYRSALQCSDKGWQYYFSELKIEPLTLWYEDLAADYERSIRDVLSFLKLDSQPFSVNPPRHVKAADTRSLEWIEEFKKMHSLGSAARP
jgi:LPS sulfotransferase NodH